MPYAVNQQHFRVGADHGSVGAAVVTDEGNVFVGCIVELVQNGIAARGTRLIVIRNSLAAVQSLLPFSFVEKGVECAARNFSWFDGSVCHGQ
jgi:hypothetical protein